MIIYSFKTRPLPLRSNLSSEVKLKTLSFHNTRTLVDIYIFFLDPHPPFQTPAKVSIPRNHVISLHYFQNRAILKGHCKWSFYYLKSLRGSSRTTKKNLRSKLQKLTPFSTFFLRLVKLPLINCTRFLIAVTRFLIGYTRFYIDGKGTLLLYKHNIHYVYYINCVHLQRNTCWQKHFKNSIQLY